MATISPTLLRLLDRERDEWSLYWASSRTGQLALPPVVGRFGADGRGVFLSDEVWEGTPIRCRYLWSEITESSARWEQAFSTDGGATWETNWIADFTRTSVTPEPATPQTNQLGSAPTRFGLP